MTQHTREALLKLLGYAPTELAQGQEFVEKMEAIGGKKLTLHQQRDRLIANALERVHWLGGTGEGILDAKLILNTKGGRLDIWFDPDDIHTLEKEYGPTITAFCCFEDPQAIKALGLEGNQFSGKWNWHCLDQSGVDHFIRTLERITEKETPCTATE